MATQASTGDTFTDAYITAALWAETEPETGEPLDANYDRGNVAVNVLAQMIADCKAFREKATAAGLGELIEENEEQAGHCFWLTRQHHGAGFWDSPEQWRDQETADKLTDLAHEFRELYATVDSVDGGTVYFE